MRRALFVRALAGIFFSFVGYPSLLAQATTTTLISSNYSPLYGQPFTLTATVTPAAATGKVTFYDGLTVLGTAPLIGSKASVTTSLLMAGGRIVTAYYGGGGAFQPSTSPLLPLSVFQLSANTFRSTGTYATLGFTEGVAVGDLNGDGKADLAVTDGSSRLTVLLGNGDGTFQPAVTYLAGNGTTAVVIGDFNGDGKPDLAVNNIIASTIHVLLGNGDGTFQAPINTVANVGSIASVDLKAGDFNGDGKLDLAVLSYPGISILLGKGDGTFQTPITYTLSQSGFNLGNLAVADFNGDGKADLAITDDSVNPGNLSVLLGNGDGTFRPARHSTVGQYLISLTAGDFNGDGKTDLAASMNGAILILFGNGDGTFQTPLNYPTNAYARLFTADLNGDGTIDVGEVDQNTNTLMVLFGNGDGTFRGPATWSVGPGGVTVFGVAGDFNGDGRADVALSYTSGFVGILLGTAAPLSTTTLTSAPNPSAYGQTDTLTAVVSPSTATGTVSFSDGPNLLGTQTLVNGRATLTPSLLSIGTHPLYALYSGDVNYGFSHSAIVTQTVNRAMTASTTTLTTPANLVPFGLPTALTATVSPAQATGKVTFYDGENLLGIGTVTGGQALLTTSLLPSGTRRLSAQYTGDATFAASLSPVVSLTVLATPSDGFQLLNVAAGTYTSVAVADFNGDNKQDVVACSGTVVMVFLGKGDGTFQPPTSTTVGGTLQKIATGDFNRDGKTDLAVVDASGNRVVVLLGKGDGTFQTPVAYAIGFYGRDIVIADFNGDGKADLMVGGSDLDLLLGNGDGTFQPAVDLAQTIVANRLAVGDFNGDGITDLAMTRPSGAPFQDDLLIYLGRGDGTFQAPIPYNLLSTSWGIAVGDFNGDGKLDLAVTNGANLVALAGHGDGTFSQTGTYAIGSGEWGASLVVGDFNGDGQADLAVAVFGGITLLLGKGDGTFFLRPSYLNLAGNPFAVGDFNGDGRTDLVISADAGLVVALGTSKLPTATSLAVSLNPTVAGQSLTLTATASSTFGGPVGSGSVTFYDGTSLLGTRAVVNGQASLVTSTLPPGTHTLKAQFVANSTYAGSSSATLSQKVTPVPAAGLTAISYSKTGSFTSVVVADLNRDGKADLVIADSLGYANVLLGNGDGTFGTPGRYQFSNGVAWVAVGDFNGDGIPDLAGVDYGYQQMDILLGNGDGTFRQIPPVATNYASCIVVGDFNGDGKADLAFSAGTSVSILLGNGDGTFLPPITFSADAFPVYLVAGDFNGDGKTDLAVANIYSNDVSMLLGNGDGTFQAAKNFRAGSQPTAVDTGDFNGDGKLDLVVSDFDGAVSVLLGNGDGTFQPAVSYSAGTQPNGVVVGDLNGDGKADIVVANFGGSLSILTGNGNGTFQPAVDYPVGGQLTTDAIGDFNGDGRQDVVAVGQDGSIIILLGKVPLSGAKMPATRVGVFRAGVVFLEDTNGNTAYDPGVDRFIPNFTGPGGFIVGDMPVVGDWTGDGNTKAGIYRSSTGTWFLDTNNNGIFDAGDYQYQFGGLAGDIPFAGDWNGLGKSCIGLYRTIGSVWLLDLNCNGVFENNPSDAFFPFGGVAGDVPVVGSWIAGTTRVGVVRKYAPGGIPQGNPFYWVLDGGAASAGPAAASHQPGYTFAFGGLPGDVFVTGDWYATGISSAAVFRNGFWVLDAAAPSAPQASHVTGLTFGYGGVPGDIPVAGKW